MSDREVGNARRQAMSVRQVIRATVQHQDLQVELDVDLDRPVSDLILKAVRHFGLEGDAQDRYLTSPDRVFFRDESARELIDDVEDGVALTLCGTW